MSSPPSKDRADEPEEAEVSVYGSLVVDKDEEQSFDDEPENESDVEGDVDLDVNEASSPTNEVEPHDDDCGGETDGWLDEDAPVSGATLVSQIINMEKNAVLVRERTPNLKDVSSPDSSWNRLTDL
jgi:hypothetical protein